VRSSLRTELSENFLNGLQKLFTEHYIDVPESKTDVVKSLTRHVETLKRQVNEQYAEKLKLHRLAETANKKRIVATFARDMSESQAGKLEKLAEDTQYVNANDFREKLSMLKESYFKKQPSRATRLPEENVQEVTEQGAVKGEADMVADAITRQAKSSDW
jgi:pyridoxine 5'-phosphate synthase PdxJ